MSDLQRRLLGYVYPVLLVSLLVVSGGCPLSWMAKTGTVTLLLTADEVAGIDAIKTGEVSSAESPGLGILPVLVR